MVECEINRRVRVQCSGRDGRYVCCQDGRRRAVQELALGIFADKAMMLGCARLFVEAVMPVRRNSEKPGEKPQSRAHAGNQRAKPSAFDGGFPAHKR